MITAAAVGGSGRILGGVDILCCSMRTGRARGFVVVGFDQCILGAIGTEFLDNVKLHLSFVALKLILT